MAEGVAEARVKINGTEVPTDKCSQVIIEMDLDQPDMCAATLSNLVDSEGGGQKYSETLKQGDSIEVVIGATTDTPAPLFKGEVVGIEPLWDTSGETKVTLRAFNKLHRLTRTRKSKTFENQTDTAIFKKIAADAKLTPEVKGDVNIEHKHIYQHHQTDLEFLLERSRRINYEIMVDDTKLIWRKRDLSVDSGITLKWGKDAGGAEFSLQQFKARLNTTNQVKEVTVRCWDPTQAKEIVGKATAPTTKLGDKDGAADANTAFGEQKVSYEVPVYNQEEADTIAKALLEDLAMTYIVGDGQCKGHPKLKPGLTVTIEAGDKRFDGKYYITGCSHRYTHKSGGGGSGGGAGGYLTLIRVRRNAAKSE
jgi:phage protein D